MAKRRVVEEETFGETLNPAIVHTWAVEYQSDSYAGLANLVYTLLGIVELFLAFRLLFLLLGANPNNGFVNMVYVISHQLIAPFSGVFGSVNTLTRAGLSTFDTATLVAIIVYVAVAWVIVRLVAAAYNRPPDSA